MYINIVHEFAMMKSRLLSSSDTQIRQRRSILLNHFHSSNLVCILFSRLNENHFTWNNNQSIQIWYLKKRAINITRPHKININSGAMDQISPQRSEEKSRAERNCMKGHQKLYDSFKCMCVRRLVHWLLMPPPPPLLLLLENVKVELKYVIIWFVRS